MRLGLLTLVIMAVVSAGCGGGGRNTAAITQAAIPRAISRHIVLIIEENRSFSTVYPSGMPWLSSLGNRYGIATNYYSDEPGSLLDYLWLTSGSGEESFGCNGSGCLQPITSDNIFRELNRAQMSWKVYAESLPSPGFMGDYAGNYVKRHNPAAWYSDVINDWVQQQNMVPFTQFAQDLAAENLPNYAIVVPDLTHDAHDGTIQMADLWLQQNIAPLLESSHFRAGGNGLMFITFDNGDGDAQGQVFTAVIGPKVIPGAKVGAPFRHENTLRTVIEKFGLMVFPGASTSAEPMNQFFENPDESSRERRRPHRKAPIESS